VRSNAHAYRSPRGRISEITTMQIADTAMSTIDSW
jgi:hypothetical protein